MGFIKLVMGAVGSIVAFILAMYVVGLVLKIAFFAIWLIKAAVVIGFFVLIAWVVYKIVSPKNAQA